MKDVWTSFLAPVLAALVVAYLLGNYQRTNESLLQTEVNWIETDNPFTSETFAPTLQTKDSKLDIALRSELSRVFDSYNRIRVVTLEIRNASERVAKDIKVSLPSGGIFLKRLEGSANFSAVTQVDIENLAPGADYSMLAMLRPSFAATEPNVLVLHDGMRAPLVSFRTPEYLRWWVSLFDTYPFLFFAIVPSCLVLGFVTLIFLPVGMYAEKNPAFKAAISSKADIRKLQTFLDYLRDHRPDKLSPSPEEAVAPTPPASAVNKPEQ